MAGRRHGQGTHSHAGPGRLAQRRLRHDAAPLRSRPSTRFREVIAIVGGIDKLAMNIAALGEGVDDVVGAVAADPRFFVFSEDLYLVRAVSVGEDVDLALHLERVIGFGGVDVAAGGAAQFLTGLGEALLYGLALEQRVRVAGCAGNFEHGDLHGPSRCDLLIPTAGSESCHLYSISNIQQGISNDQVRAKSE